MDGRVQLSATDLDDCGDCLSVLDACEHARSRKVQVLEVSDMHAIDLLPST